MKKCLVGIFVLFLPLLGSAQATRKIEKQNPNDANVEYYSVLLSDSTIKHGPYKMVYFFGGEPMLVGHYKMGHKDSTWKEYCIWDNFIQSTGKYHEDKRVGEWTFFRKRRDVEMKYNYDTKQITFFTFDSGAKKIMVKGKKQEVVELDRPPMYIGGKLAVMTFIAKNLKYPEAEYQKGIHGNVEVAVEVTAKGAVKRVWAFREADKNLNAAAVDIVKKLPPQWMPALYKGKPVNALFFVEVPFVLR